MFFWDPTFLLIIPALVFALWAQNRVKSAYRRYLQVPSRGGLSGRDVAERILASQGLQGVSRQDRLGFAKCDMAGRLAPAQLIVVHRRKIVVDQ